MSFLKTVRAKRQKLADVLSDEEYSGIREIVEELYPDQAHFIYELLQNAEDVGASEAKFSLSNEALRFEHNGGRPFDEDDIWAITNIGKGTKKNEPDKIGRFGVGFKAVFAYSETPRIWSKTYSFQISDLVLPKEIPSDADLGRKTRFAFPFNNPKKKAPDAYLEVKEGLEELAETTLLFLKNLESISWEVDSESFGKIQRVQHSKNHIEVLKQIGQKTTQSSHFLRFTDSVKGLKEQFVSVAFVLDFIPNVSEFNSDEDLAKQLRIVSANPGRVSVSFPTEKETSGLRFHLHAPFVPELSRASIKDTPANTPLFQQLAILTTAALYSVRDQHLLNGEFLGVLPNSQDKIPDRYLPISVAVLEAMNSNPLTPTFSRSHAPARQLLRARASFKEFLSLDDLKFLVDSHDAPPKWAIGAAQRSSNVDRFLYDLAITDWDVPQFAAILHERTRAYRPDEEFMTWLKSKPVEWHQRMYAFLEDDLPTNYLRRARIIALQILKIVRLGNGNYEVGKKCYFPSDNVKQDSIFPCVEDGVYSSGKNKVQQEGAKKLLKEIGVGDIGLVDVILVILKTRYVETDLKPDINHLKFFISLIEKEPAKSAIFADHFILKNVNGTWSKPEQIYLDTPFQDTGLNNYYDAIPADAEKKMLSREYLDLGISGEKLVKFAKAVGVQDDLKIEKRNTLLHRDRDSLMEDYFNGARTSVYVIDEDWYLPNLDKVLSQPSLGLSLVIWNAMRRTDKKVLSARYRPNAQFEPRVTDSSLVINLRELPWIPQRSGEYVAPPQASRDLLPNGYAFDGGEPWLIAIRFGEEEEKRSEEHTEKQTAAVVLGFKDMETVERAKRFAEIPQQEQERILADNQDRQEREPPEHEPRDSKARTEKVVSGAQDAPEREIEERLMRVNIHRARVNQRAEHYLRLQYTIDDEMICQICMTKSPLPFKLDNGSYYFEKVDFLPDLNKLHYQNNLALCPNHGAMFRHANGSRDSLKPSLLEIDGNELRVNLALEETTIYFTKTHIVDLRAVIEADASLTTGDNDG
jgi:hypothetical protein